MAHRLCTVKKDETLKVTDRQPVVSIAINVVLSDNTTSRKLNSRMHTSSLATTKHNIIDLQYWKSAPYS